MPKYSYKAKNAENKLVEGVKVAASERELVTLLKNEGLSVFAITATSSDAGVVTQAASSGRQKSVKFKRSGGGVKFEDLAIFCRQMSTLINAGVNILDAIDDIADMVSSAQLHSILKNIVQDIKGGSTLSEAMRKYNRIFGKVFISMIAAGEKSGKLGKVLSDLADYQENAVKLRRKIKAASVYPCFVGGFFMVVLAGLVLFIIPRFESMFASFGADLPLPTKMVMGVSNFAIHNIVWIMLLIIGAVVGYVMANRTPAGKFALDGMKLKVPIFGPMLLKIVFARFFQTMATLLKSGVDIVASLEIAGKVADNLPIEAMIENVKNRVVEGSTLSEEMARMNMFPRIVVRMTAVGEKSGQLDEMFSKLSDYYSNEVDTLVAMMSSIIEPFLIIMLGLVVGIAVVAMYLPIFKLAMAMMGGQS